MTLNGMIVVTSDYILRALEIQSENSLYQEPYKTILDGIRKVRLEHVIYYNKADIDNLAKEKEAKEIFLKQVQSCILLLLDIVKDTKTNIANKLGFKNIGSLDNFLDKQNYNKLVATTYVKMCRHYMWVVKRYDRGDY